MVSKHGIFNIIIICYRNLIANYINRAWRCIGYKQCLLHGLKSSIKTSIYIRIGETIVMAISLFALSSTSSTEQHFHIIKIFGGGYLIYIGLMGLINKKQTKKRAKPFLIPLLNPKAYLFFAALIPTFIDNNTNITLNFFYIGCFIYIYIIPNRSYLHSY